MSYGKFLIQNSKLTTQASQSPQRGEPQRQSPTARKRLMRAGSSGLYLCHLIFNRPPRQFGAVVEIGFAQHVRHMAFNRALTNI